MREQHATIEALAARGLGIDRKTARRFAYAATGDQAVAGAICRPTVLDRYQPHLYPRWNEGCHDVAAPHAEITALGYRGSSRTLYRYLQPDGNMNRFKLMSSSRGRFSPRLSRNRT